MPTINAKANGDKHFTLFVADGDGAPIDLTGATFLMQARRPGDPVDAPSLELTGPVGVNVEGLHIQDGPGGELAGYIAQATLEALGDTTGRLTLAWDVRCTLASGDIVVPGDEGVLNIDYGVSR